MTTLNGQWKPQLFTSLPNSLREKLVEKYDPINRPITKENFIHEIEDLAGIRLVVCQKGHISKVINRLRSMAEEGLTIERKSSSYCSRHFILASTTEFDSDNLIKYELQVRTILEEAMFENVHRFFFYKKEPIDNTIGDTLQMLAEMLESADTLLGKAYAQINS